MVVYSNSLVHIHVHAKMKKTRISASLLSADLRKLNLEIYSIDDLVDEYHIDVMDGHFAPNLSFGPDFVKAVRKLTRKPLDVHLMVEKPGNYIDMFADAGADMITFHDETENYFHFRDAVKKKNLKVGIAYNPITPAYIFDGEYDRVLLMSVKPGFAGQAFRKEVLNKLYLAHKWVEKKKFKTEIAVDGGINYETAYQAARHGADVIVAGSYIFKNNYRQNIYGLRQALFAGYWNKKKTKIKKFF